MKKKEQTRRNTNKHENNKLTCNEKKEEKKARQYKYRETSTKMNKHADKLTTM